MSVLLTFLLCLLVTIGYCDDKTGGAIVRCKKQDKPCILTSTKLAWKRFVQGYPELGVESSDPLRIKRIVGDISTLKFNFTDTIATGFVNCELEDTNLDVDNLNLKVTLICKDLNLKGHYSILGQLIILPVQGDGAYEFLGEKWIFKVDADLKRIQMNGKEYLTVANFKPYSDPVEPIHFDFQNLFNGQKDLADNVLKFANENWKEVADFVKDPVTTALLKKLVKNFNKFLMLVSADELFLD